MVVQPPLKVETSYEVKLVRNGLWFNLNSAPEKKPHLQRMGQSRSSSDEPVPY